MIAPMREDYRTLSGEARHEIDKIKGSRFIASVAPVASEEQARALEEGVRREFNSARHHCSAWRLGLDSMGFRYNDDGEPSGSAGRPILQQIDALELTNVAVIVTRYFGGTKLGVGGLVRAYGQAAREGLGSCPIRTVILTQRLRVEHPYECSSAVQALLAKVELTPSVAQYEEQVRLCFDVPLRLVVSFQRELLERTAGRAQLTVEDLEEQA